VETRPCSQPSGRFLPHSFLLDLTGRHERDHRVQSASFRTGVKEMLARFEWFVHSMMALSSISKVAGCMTRASPCRTPKASLWRGVVSSPNAWLRKGSRGYGAMAICGMSAARMAHRSFYRERGSDAAHRSASQCAECLLTIVRSHCFTLDEVSSKWGVSSRRTDFYATGLVINKGVGDRKLLGV
jgi:hypothetical protein